MKKAFANADLSYPDGIWYGVNRSTNSNVILDRFNLPSSTEKRTRLIGGE